MSAAAAAWAVLAAGLVVRAASIARPAPARVRALAPRGAGRRDCVEGSGGRHRLPGLGRGLRVAVVVLGAAVHPILGFALALVAWRLPIVAARRRQRAEVDALEADLAPTVALLALAVGGGSNLRRALEDVALVAPGPLAPHLADAVERAANGMRLADSLDALPAHAGPATRPLASALAGAERYGVPLVSALDRLGDELRHRARRRAEARARRLPVLLLFPLVLCILPAFALLTVAPLLAGALRALRP